MPFFFSSGVNTLHLKEDYNKQIEFKKGVFGVNTLHLKEDYNPSIRGQFVGLGVNTLHLKEDYNAAATLKQEPMVLTPSI